ncbi:Putative Holliday junction resolvase [Rickettsiales bacterium Ac37b]|nr:Putative Holliday junction resolvase [Rickettsiales bacterium Ac37b]
MYILPKGRILGLDVGLKTLGIALTDIDRLIASPYDILLRKTFKKDLYALNNLITQKNICGMVIGFPKQMDGVEGSACIMVKNFTDKLDQYFNIPIFFQDERLTTAAALRILKESGMSRKKIGNLDDKIAASYILQTVLDQMRLMNAK